MGIKLVDREMSVFNISSQHSRFRSYRKQLHSGLNSQATQSYIPLINQETRIFLTGLASTPENFISHIRRWVPCYTKFSRSCSNTCRNAGAVVLKIAYGWTVSDNNDLLVDSAEEATHLIADLFIPGRWLVESIPWLRFVPSWAPGAGFKRRAAYVKERMKRLDQTGFDWAKEQIVRMSPRSRSRICC